MNQSSHGQRRSASGIESKRVTRLGVTLAALVLAAFATPVETAGAHPYYAVDQSRMTISYAYDENGQIDGVQGQIKGGYGVCSLNRPVRVRSTLEDGGTNETWLLNRASWVVQDARPGTYRARIFSEVRFQRIDGKRRRILCTGASSPRLTIPPSSSPDP